MSETNGDTAWRAAAQQRVPKLTVLELMRLLVALDPDAPVYVVGDEDSVHPISGKLDCIAHATRVVVLEDGSAVIASDEG